MRQNPWNPRRGIGAKRWGMCHIEFPIITHLRPFVNNSRPLRRAFQECEPFLEVVVRKFASPEMFMFQKVSPKIYSKR